MKKILGLDLGTTSIGWALVEEAENENEISSITKLGVRVVPLTTDEQNNFEKGQTITTTADRTLKRGARRNLQRFKLRRESLIKTMRKHHLVDENTVLTEMGKKSTFDTLKNRAKAVKEKISKEDLARVFLKINGKRGYKSGKIVKDNDEGNAIDGMGVAKELYDNRWTPGEYVLKSLKEGKKYIPDFYPSDLNSEFDTIWDQQANYYPEVLTTELKSEIIDKNKSQTWAILKEPLSIVGIKVPGKKEEVQLQKYEWRVDGLSKKLEPEQLAIVLQEINNDKNKTSGYLGAISDRSKILYIDKISVGEYLYKQLLNNPNKRIKGQIFYRQDYLDEFEQIWEQQKLYHPELTLELKEEIRDHIIFYQRRLKSQKSLISFCEFESKKIKVKLNDGRETYRMTGSRVIPRSSPLFQYFKIYQNINALRISSDEFDDEFVLDDDSRRLLFYELWVRGDLKETEVLKTLGLNTSNWKTNFKSGLSGNRFNAQIFNILQLFSENEGYGFDWNKKSALEIIEELKNTLPSLNVDPTILEFYPQENLDSQKHYKLWHLIYATQEDSKIEMNENDILTYGNSMINLKKQLHKKFGFPPTYAKMLAGIRYEDDYGNLSAKAIKKILPFMMRGKMYNEACDEVGYNHSSSMTSDENKNRDLKPKMEILPKNSLRNPVVEKILNQMVHVINGIIDQYGKPDEVRIELARELKQSAEERSRATKGIDKARKINEDTRKILQKEFNISNPSRNDVIRYKLYEELAPLNYKSIYSNQFIPREMIFSKDVDIEHIIPKARLFNDSFSNKTLEFKDVNRKKDNRTAIDFIEQDYIESIDDYKSRVMTLYDSNMISPSKKNNLLIHEKDLPDDFLNRDLRNTQYISRKATELLLEVFRNVNTTTGEVTAALRKDWGLMEIIQEINMPLYKELGQIETIKRKDGKLITRIKDWSKRDDHRHHAVDALTVAFTKPSHIQYLNNKNAASNKDARFLNLEKSIMHNSNGNDRKTFIPPINNLRSIAKEKLEEILVSYKTKNKVVTRNLNKSKKKGGFNRKVQLTPRGQLHNETIYAKRKSEVIKMEKVSAKFDFEKIHTVCNPVYKEALLKRLEEFEGDSKKAFSGKNTITKNPIIINDGKEMPIELKCKQFDEIFTIRKDVNSDLNLDKVIDTRIKRLLENRLEEFGGDKKKAFSDLEKYPIWLNEEKGISIKKVTISAVNNAVPLRNKKNHLGNPILQNGKEIENDFVQYGNNHHVAIFEDENGDYQEVVVPFALAVARAVEGVDIVQKELIDHPSWKFVFSLKQNEMFLIPSKSFNPMDYDIMDINNLNIISKHLFRVQKIATKDYWFAHHLKTKAVNNEDVKIKNLIGINFNRIRSASSLKGFVKVRINHQGKIVHIGEY